MKPVITRRVYRGERFRYGRNVSQLGPRVVDRGEPVVARAPCAAPETECIRLTYGPFALASPRFVCSEDADWWQGYSPIPAARRRLAASSREELDAAPLIREQLARTDRQMVVFHTPEYEMGRVVRLAGFSLAMPHDCGQRGRYQELAENAVRRLREPAARRVDAESSLFLFIPATWSFQHWIDSTLPKLAQIALAAVRLPADVRVMQELDERRFPIVPKLWEHLGVPRAHLVDDLDCVVSARESIYACNTPPHHPALWRKGQELLGVPRRFIPLEQRRKVCVLSRSAGAGVPTNPGRRNKNEREMLAAIKRFLAAHPELSHLEVEVFNHERLGLNIDAHLDYFADVRVLLGAHGGALTNLIFAAPGTTVIELWVHHRWRGRATVGHEALAYWYQSTLLDMDYWLIRTPTGWIGDDFRTDVGNVIRALKGALLGS